ncbi:MAG: MBL fold metallo-hydrolase [Eggerthellaceae bacterium]
MADGKIKIHVLHTGEVCVAPDLPFGGDETNIVKASGLFTKRDDRLWLPVSAYLIEHPEHGLILVDTGWDRSMSPEGTFDRAAQIHSLGSPLLYKVNQGVLPLGEAVDEQLAQMGIVPADLDMVLLTHLDCDHANGLRQVRDAKRILVAVDEVECARKNAVIRYQRRWWQGVDLEQFEWNGTEGPFQKSYDPFGDDAIVCVNIPGHADGLFAVKVYGADGRFVLLFSDGGYAAKSWQEMITSGISLDKEKQKTSLAWISEQSLDPLCVESLANHDPEVVPHIIEL